MSSWWFPGPVKSVASLSPLLISVKRNRRVLVTILHVVQEADENERKVREKQARVEASMKEREKEVKESLESSLRERDKERDQHKNDEAVQTFKALLADLVKIALEYVVQEYHTVLMLLHLCMLWVCNHVMIRI